MKVLLFVLLLACFAIVVADGSVVKSNVKSNVATQKTVKATAKHGSRPTTVSKKQAKVVSKKANAVVAHLVQDNCNSLTTCQACFANSTCYFDTAALQCRTIGLVGTNEYCPSSSPAPSSASVIAISSLLMAIVAILFV